MIITIDGPSASGKSYTARLLAQKLGLKHLNSGLLFRALAYILVTYFDYSPENLVYVRREDIDKILSNNFEYLSENGFGKVIYNQRDLTPFLKSQKIDQAASILSTVPYVREVLLNYQRHYALENSIVVDGRDAGSVVFPNAQVKIFLTASPEIRAQRWHDDMLQKGKKYTFEHSLKEITTRDERDKMRSNAPLVIPEGAIVIDNSNLDVNQTLDKIMSYIF